MKTRNGRPWLIFDYDDTLGGVEIDGQIRPGGEAYDVVLTRFAARMEEIGLGGEKAREEQLRLDVELCRTHGFDNLDRFPMSLSATYEKLARNAGGAFPSISEEMREIGYGVYRFPYVALPGARDVLRLTRDRYNIAIVTKGNETEQRKKLCASNTIEFADIIHVCGRKDDHDWRFALDMMEMVPSQLRRSWAIGNSLKSDVNPLLRMGMNGIYVPAYGWAFEAEEAARPREGREYHVVQEIREVLDVLQLSTVK